MEVKAIQGNFSNCFPEAGKAKSICGVALIADIALFRNPMLRCIFLVSNLSVVLSLLFIQ